MSVLSQSLIDAAAEATVTALRDETGGCHCDQAYIDRGKLDPDCVYHQVGGTEFAALAAEVAVVAVLETLATHTGPARADGPVRVWFLNHEEFKRLAAEVREGTP